MEKKSKVIDGNAEDIEVQINELINEGYKVHTFIHIDGGEFYALLIKE